LPCIQSVSTTEVTWAAHTGRGSRLNAQSGATLGAARGQYSAAAFRFHAGAESVGAFAFDYTGLKSAFHRAQFWLRRLSLQKAGKLTAFDKGLSTDYPANYLYILATLHPCG
jgi:hypothetical protein